MNITSRDIWTHGGGWPLPDVLKTCLSSLIIKDQSGKPIYFASPWITDFELFDNRYKEFSSLFTELSDRSFIMFSDFLTILSHKYKIRVIITKNERSNSFTDNQNFKNIKVKFAKDDFHEKGILTNYFYIEGSMNITEHGVRVRGEKIVYHSVKNKNEQYPSKFAQAYLEFNRFWENCNDA